MGILRRNIKMRIDMFPWIKGLGIFMALVMGAGFAASAQAQDCPRGALDKAYCDRDGDLVADAPTDTEQMGQSLDHHLLLHAGRGPGGLSEGLGRLHQAHGEGHRQEGGVLPGAVECRPARGDAFGPPARRRRQHRRQSDRGQLRRLRAVRDDGGQGRIVRLRDGNHRAGRQRDQDARRSQGQDAGLHLADVQFRLQGAVGAPARPSSTWKPRRTSSRRSPASTTIRFSASPTRTTTPRPSRIRCSSA